MATRLVLRQLIGQALGRRYYTTSTVSSTATVNELPDVKRTEHAAEWDGATLLVNTQQALVRGTSTGRIFLDTDLTSVPDVGSAIEMVKGYTFTDLNDAIDYGHTASYPYIWLPVHDRTTVTETTGVDEYALPATWRIVSGVSREVVGSTAPVTYIPLTEGIDYELVYGTESLVYRSLNSTVTGTHLWFTGEGLLTIGSSDASSSIAPTEVIKHAALFWLYDKGASPDEMALKRSFQQEAEKEKALWEEAKRMFAMPREHKRKVKRPKLNLINEGTSQVAEGW